jgi:chromosome segregation ATPase
MSVIQLENDLSKVDERLRECFDKALGFEVQKELEAERKELSDKIFYEKNLGMQREVLELESEIESKVELAETHRKAMVNLAKEIDDMTIELLEMQKLHAGWSAQKYLAESNVQTLRTMIRELKRNRQIMVSERLASERYEARKDM